MNNQSKEYQEWMDSHEGNTAKCNRVVKLDCIGHVQKRLGNALRKLKKTTKGKLSDGKIIGGKEHRLPDKTIDKLQQHYGKVIRRTVNRGAV